MKRLSSFCLSILVFLAIPALARAERQQGAAPEGALRVVSVGPDGEIASLAEANEIRVVFSEPMVTLGRIPAQVRADFFRITPAVAGTFRWSGTTILIFTPNPKRPLPFATRYSVTIDTTAAAVSGRKLAQPVTFSFTTPTVKLLKTEWFRRGGGSSGALVVLMWFNQPIRPADIAQHLSARFEPHGWELAQLEETRALLKTAAPQALQQLDAKVAATRAIAASTSPVQLAVTDDWDKKMHPPVRELAVFEARTPVPPESHIRLELDSQAPSPAGRATPAGAQHTIVEVERAFFVEGFHCKSGCNPDARNPIVLRQPVKVVDFASAVSAGDVTAGGRPTVVRAAHKPRTHNEYGDRIDEEAQLTLEDAGFDAQPPARTYAVSIAAGLRSIDGQTLGYTWVGTAENWHRPAFTSFGDGQGVWETGGGNVLPFYARNFTTVTQWAAPVRPAELMPLVARLQSTGFVEAPPGDGVSRRLPATPDRIQSHGLDLSRALEGRQTGLVWTAVKPGAAIPKSNYYGDSATRAALVQVTNLGISVKDSPQNTLVFVTRLDNGAPVPGAAVSIINTDNKVFWRGTTGADGVAIARDTPLRSADDWWEFRFIVMAEKDGDVAYVGSNWNEGISPWEFDVSYNLNQAEPLLRGTVFTDRGVYRLGEDVHFKAILRENSPAGIRFLPAGTSVFITIRDGEYRLIDSRTVKVGAWSSAEWTMTLPHEGSLGNYHVRAILERDKPVPKTPEERRRWAQPGSRDDDSVRYERVVNGSFLVAAYRRPDFRVDVTLTGNTAIAGTALNGLVTARYLFGAPMGARPVSWRFSRNPGYSVPASIREHYADDRWEFVGWGHENSSPVEIRAEETDLEKTGELPLALETAVATGIPYVYTLEADVEDVSRQHIANRASVTIHPAPWYVGVRRPKYFLEQKDGLTTDLVTVGLDGRAVAGVKVDVTLTQIQWNSVRRAEGNGFYTWVTERKEVPSGNWTVTTADKPVPLEIPFSNGGYFILEARGEAEGGRFAVTRTSFYVLGNGYTAWERYDHNRIDLIPERQTYKPGDTARIMVQSPWEQATALVTTEREGIRYHRQFQLTSTQQSITVPVTDADIPNLYVSVLLIKGRSAQPPSTADPAPQESGPNAGEADTSDPGKPSFRLGYVEIDVEDASKRLAVSVSANKQEYRPANAANVVLNVKDHEGRGAASEVTLWAVDYGVLSLTAYRTPDVLRSVYVEKALQVMNVDSRQRIVSRRVLTPKGDTDGGGGGADTGAGTMRKDFRVLAFWLGSVVTDAQGQASVEVKLPESLTTYRIMAVAADRNSRFGSADTEIRVNKPLTLKPAFPRFLAVGDRAYFGAVITNQLKTGGPAVITMKSLDPALMEISGGEQTVNVAPGGSIEARFEAMGRAIGRARVQMTVKLAAETDAFEDVIPIEVLASPETVAAYGEAGPAGATATAKETITLPAGVVPGFGGLHVEMSSTAMVGLGEGARYLVEYPYGCAEQRGSRALALLLAADLGDAFTLPGMDTAKMRPAVQQTLKELEKYQCGNGGFAYWPGACFSVSPYLTSYLLHVFKVASDLKYDVNGEMVERAYGYLEQELAREPPVNEGWWPSYTAWQAFAVKVLTEGGRNQDSNINRLYTYRDRMPIFALAYLHDALVARGEPSGPRAADLRRRITNAILPEAGSAHVEELSDPYLLWFWNSNVRSTAIVLNSFAKAGVSDAPYRGLVRWMMAVRKDGRWGNTQENAHAMEALVNYYRRYESAVPDFRAVVTLGPRELAREEFKGRSATAASKDVPMTQLLATGPAGTKQPLTFSRQGTGTLFYTARLRYAADTLFHDGLDAGFNVERVYSPYVETGTRPATATFKAGDLVQVTLRFRLTKERRFVAVTDPLPAGFEPVESWFATTARALAANQDRQGETSGDWFAWWRIGGFDHVERHDDRVQLFATRLSEGVHEFSYIVRATTAGTFRTAPARAEEMYEPEVFGRTGTAVIEIRR